MTKINEFIARKLTLIFGTMWVFYAFFLYGFLPLIPILKPYEIQILYWSSTVQLWSLPLIIVGQNILGRDTVRRAIETHDAVMKELLMANEERAELLRIVEELNMVLRKEGLL